MKDHSHYLKILFILGMLCSGCIGQAYHSAPPQHLPAVSGPTTVVTIINPTGGNVEFYNGPLKGLILAPWESYRTELPLGYQTHSWSQEVLHKANIKNYSDKIIVTHKSRSLLVVPPPRDDVFRTRGSGSLYLRDY